MKINNSMTLKSLKLISKSLLLVCILNSFSSCTNDEITNDIIIEETETVTKEDIDEEIDINEEVDDNNETQLTEAEELLALVNEFRISEGEDPLSLNSALNQAAYDHSDDMNTNDYFDHTGLNGSRFWERAEDAGYTGSPIGENIALGQRDVQSVFNAWESSEGHRANMLRSSATEMGLGHSGSYWTQIFGRN